MSARRPQTACRKKIEAPARVGPIGHEHGPARAQCPISDGRRFRVLAIVDDYTRECLALVADVVANLDEDSNYVAIFIPGGHGALIGLPESADVAAAIRWALSNDRYLISLCHGPAAFIAPSIDGKSKDHPLAGYSIPCPSISLAWRARRAVLA